MGEYIVTYEIHSSGTVVAVGNSAVSVSGNPSASKFLDEIRQNAIDMSGLPAASPKDVQVTGIFKL